MQMKIDNQTRGMRIIAGNEAIRRRVLLNKFMFLADLNSFNEIVLPSVEPAIVYVDKAGNEVLNQMYTFLDKKGRELCLRPEVTATIQLIADKYWPQQKDVKLWYFEKCWRYEKPQKGRYREFYQFGLEWINPKDLEFAEKSLIRIAEGMVEIVTSDYETQSNVKRGLDYYIEDGFEITVPSLGAQKQVVGGGKYKQGIGFALGFDRLLAVNEV